MQSTILAKNRRLGEILHDMDHVMVAFSGGVDSALVLKRAQQELGEKVLAVVVASETYRRQEFQSAVQLAEDMGANLYKTEIKELENEGFVANTPDSWYHGKALLYGHLKNLAQELCYPYVVDGTNMEDLSDFRPGLKAKTEQGIRSPLQEAGFYKNEIRELAKELGISVWDKPASCNLSSRIPYGTRIDKHKIEQVDVAELFLAQLGFCVARVRHHGKVARIEVIPEDIQKAIKHREIIHEKFTALGFTYVALDLQGYRMGSMNEGLGKKTPKEAAVV
jgi:uncharacterized protein